MRPTSALVRQALFDILGADVVGAAVLDLYAGSGAVGFEALSRGAGSALFVENDASIASLIEATAERFGCAERCRVLRADVLAWLRRRPADAARTDLCFVDAPYRDDSVNDALALLGLGPPALVVCEHHRARRLPDAAGALRRYREATYGETQLSFFRREPVPAGQGGDERR
jgi:16S rRNA (guanine966-N2)-methyltransferase